MDCQSEEHKCDELYGECRCYADVNTKNPGSEQVCGIRKKGYIIPCKAGCCDGGCPPPRARRVGPPCRQLVYCHLSPEASLGFVVPVSPPPACLVSSGIRACFAFCVHVHLAQHNAVTKINLIALL